MRIYLVIALVLSGTAAARLEAQVPCLWDPVTGRPVVPQGHQTCSVRPAAPPPAPSSRLPVEPPEGTWVNRAETAAERRERERRNAAIAAATKEAREAYDEAVGEWEKGNFRKAIEKMRNAVDKARRLSRLGDARVDLPESFMAELYRMQARLAARNDDHDAAETFARLARQAHPGGGYRHDDFDNWLASDRAAAARVRRMHDLNGMVDRGEFATAIDTANALLAQYPDTWEFHDALTRSLVATERWDEAEPALVRQLRLAPETPALIRDLGYVAGRKGDFDAAEALLSETRLFDASDGRVVQALEVLRTSSPAIRAGSREAAVRTADAARQAWKMEVNRRLQNIDVRNTPPLAARDFHAGDVLILAPDDLKGALTAVTDQLVRGSLFDPEAGPRVSHALTFIGRDARGRGLFLDNVPGQGPQVIGQTEFEQRYGSRQTYVARPQKAVDGAELLRAAQQQVRANQNAGLLDTRYGVFGDDLVCSESAGVAVARATSTDLIARLGGRLGPIDITPADFADTRRGKFFVVMAVER